VDSRLSERGKVAAKWLAIVYPYTLGAVLEINSVHAINAE